MTALLSLFVLTACGFEPMAAHGTQAAPDNAALAEELAAMTIRVNALPEQRLLAQHFRIALEDLVNPGAQLAATPKYTLDINLGTITTPSLIAPDGKAQRFIVNLRASYVLQRIADNQEVSKGDVSRIGSYNNRPNAYYSTYVAEQDTLKRLATELAEEFRMRLASAFTHAKEAP